MRTATRNHAQRTAIFAACALLLAPLAGASSAAGRVDIVPAEGGSLYRMAPDAGADASTPLSLQQKCTTNDATATGFARAPSDVSGAVSATVLVVVTNQDIGVYNRTTCAPISRVPLATLFDAFPIAADETLFAPRVVYDFASARFFVTAQSRNGSNTDQFEYFAVSTSRTASAFRRFRVQLSRGAAFFCKSAANAYWNYPSAGLNSRRWFITGNNFPFGADPPTGELLVIDKAPSLAATGTPAVRCFKNLAPNLQPPIVRGTGTAAYFLSAGAGSGSAIRRWRLSTPGAIAADTLAATANITIPTWTAPPDATQPNGQRLSTLDGRFQSASIQIAAALWQVHTVSVGGHARWRLYKLSTTGTSPLLTLTGPAAVGSDNFNPSVATGASTAGAPAFVTFTRTIAANATGGRATMLIAKGPNNSTSGWALQGIEQSAGQFGHTGSAAFPCNYRGGSCRFGYYSATQMDPLSAAQAWGFNQLITTGNIGGLTSHFNWTTRAARVN